MFRFRKHSFCNVMKFILNRFHHQPPTLRWKSPKISCSSHTPVWLQINPPPHLCITSVGCSIQKSSIDEISWPSGSTQVTCLTVLGFLFKLSFLRNQKSLHFISSKGLRVSPLHFSVVLVLLGITVSFGWTWYFMKSKINFFYKIPKFRPVKELWASCLPFSSLMHLFSMDKPDCWKTAYDLQSSGFSLTIWSYNSG